MYILVPWCPRPAPPFSTHCVQVEEIMSLSRELGLTCITAYKMDATKAVLKTAETAQPSSLGDGLQRGNGEASCPGPAAGGSEMGGGEGERRDGRPLGGDPGPNDEEGRAEGVPQPALDRPCMSSAGAEKVLQRRLRKEAAKAARGLICPPSQLQAHCEAPRGWIGRCLEVWRMK